MANPFNASENEDSQQSFNGAQGLMGSNPSIVNENQNSMDDLAGINLGTNPKEPPNFNLALLCRIGQETVQEIVSKMTELFQVLKTIQPPTSVGPGASAQEERKAKLQETMKQIHLNYRQLRRIYEKCNESCAEMEYTHIEVDQVMLKNRQLKEIIDTLRIFIWDINTMLAARRA